MEAVSNLFSVEYQKHSLIDFLLGCNGNIGWLDTYASRSDHRSPNALAEARLEKHAAAA